MRGGLTKEQCSTCSRPVLRHSASALNFDCERCAGKKVAPKQVKKPAHVSPWRDERNLTLVKDLLAQGMSAKNIAHALRVENDVSVTRNAVIGIVTRKGWSKSGAGRGTTQHNPTRGRLPFGQKRHPKQNRKVHFGKPNTAPKVENPDVTRRLKNIARWSATETTVGVTFLDLENHHCRWPHEDGKYCGADKSPGSSYCDEHYARAYQPVIPRQRSAVRRVA